MHTVIAVSRTPHISIYEGLSELLKVCEELPARVFLVVPEVDRELCSDLARHGIEFHSLESVGIFRKVPTSLRLLAAALRLHRSHKGALFLGCDGMGNIVAAAAAKMTSTPYLHYGLELPPKRTPSMSFRQKLEHWSSRQSDLLVTMDQPHADFICAETGSSQVQIALAPNTLRGPGHRQPSSSLKTYLGLPPDAVLILHAGGIGAAQASMQLVKAVRARTWNPAWHLVFHAHCDMSGEVYYQRFSRAISESSHIHLSAQAVALEQLDDLMSNASIGLAWYDRELLGYRADLLGLAAGKIGRYLRNGVPVVSKDLPTIRAYLDKYSCGICVDNVEDVGSAVQEILADYDRYSENALRCYEELWRPDRYLTDILARIYKIINSH